MRATSILLAAATVLVLGALLVLLIQVERGPTVDVPKDELNAAMRRHDRNEAMKSATGSRLQQLRAEARAEREGERNPVPEPMVPVPTRQQPAHAKDLNEGVTDRDMAARLDNAQTLYRERKYGEAMEQATTLLEEMPDNKQLKRIAVRSACIEGNADIARKYMSQLPERDQEYLRAHCRRYGQDIK